jgi:hypothetical protein
VGISNGSISNAGGDARTTAGLETGATIRALTNFAKDSLEPKLVQLHQRRSDRLSAAAQPRDRR